MAERSVLRGSRVRPSWRAQGLWRTRLERPRDVRRTARSSAEGVFWEVFWSSRPVRTEKYRSKRNAC